MASGIPVAVVAGGPVPWSVPAFLLNKAAVGRTKRGITSFTFVRAAESVKRPGLARSSGEGCAHRLGNARYFRITVITR